jgi:hypothetical protein
MQSGETMPLATFFKFKIHIPGVSVDLTASDQAQFDLDLASADESLVGHYLMSIFEMKNASGAFTSRERGMFGIHFVNSTAGAVDTTWVTADFTAVESAIATWWASNASSLPTAVRLVEHRWYPYGPGFIGTKSSPIPPSRVNTLGTPLVGSAAEPHVRQVASNITMRTTLRRHWGRIYVPMATNLFSTNGQMGSTDVNAQASKAKTMLTGAEASQGVVPVVWDRVRHQAYGITAIEVDSIPDIQRRRRPRDFVARQILTS